jgi:predicted ABC-type transport system involved in lysophospholipase L1 biosynthesis ATPase subunit
LQALSLVGLKDRLDHIPAQLSPPLQKLLAQSAFVVHGSP